MKHYIVKYSLRNKLLIAFLLTGILPALFLGFFLYYFELENTVSSVKNSLDTGLKQFVDLAEESTFAVLQGSAPELADLLAGLEQLPYIHRAQAADTVQAENKPFSFAETVRIGDTDHRIIMTLDSNYIEGLLGQRLFPYGYAKMISLEENGADFLAREEKRNSADYIVNGETLFSKQILLVEYIDRDIVLRDSFFVGEISIRTSFIIVIVAICLAFGMSYRISYGVDNLIAEMKRVRSGDFSDIPATDSQDEIGLLSQSFRNMTAELDTLINKTYKLKISEREARLKTLQSQISPHFLYNALDSINWALIEKGDYETSEVLIALSAVLRYSIDQSKEMVALEEEFLQVENYLKIQKNRFADRFDYELSLDDEIKKLPVPKMILQPIVENALSHGLEDHKDGKLVVKGTLLEKGVSIAVTDNGKGIEPEKLANLRTQIKRPIQMVDNEGFHMGLTNVNSRLRYVFGAESGISIESIQNVCTVVTLYLQSGGG